MALDKKIEKLKVGVDATSVLVLDYLKGCMYDSLFFNGANFANAHTKLPDFQYKYWEQWLKEKAEFGKQYSKMGIEKVSPEVVFFRHGLMNCDKAILDYIKKRDIFDLGAYIGDSALVLSQYTDANVLSFELSHKNAEQFRNNIELSGIKNVVLIESGVSDRSEYITINDTGKANTGIWESGSENVKLTTVDEEVRRLQANVGFIKADLEGVGLKMMALDYYLFFTLAKKRERMNS